ncbi:magnesium-translocating P-type ATPase [Thermoflexibacter ruber]|uniref:Magnesium-transporting ATPase, P-type 1 n=1 Tax=Thermoflexibacter ruber TaxID=1003 RepID=A0A1I2DMI4_9BACT|nr:magnesium-translocating P-type ATPase [Thermoflexibacter ruber]SFE81473.1 Mg2+-importing ATPase [Thermoflexibacter ruber]
MPINHLPFWSFSLEEAFTQVQSKAEGLSSAEAKNRLRQFGKNSIKESQRASTFLLLINQFKSPISLLLIFAAILSFLLNDPTDAVIIFIIILLSGLLSFWQEKRASSAMQKLLSAVKVTATVYRDKQKTAIPLEEVVKGDVLWLSAGDVIPADCLILESNNLIVNEVSLTGESFPIDKSTGKLPVETPLAKRTNSLFMGSNVISGSGKALVVSTGKNTELGKIAHSINLLPPETDFEKGIRHFGFLLTEVTLILVFIIFALNVALQKPMLDAFLFSLAIAVGLTPQLLPAIISVNLSKGARRMAQKKVIVKRLSAIENFGSMNVLCSDKTGTLTEGQVKVSQFVDVHEVQSEKILQYAVLNASLQQGFKNPIDQAIQVFSFPNFSSYAKQDEIPYDFIRKRLSVLVSSQEGNILISKGALKNILSVCSKIETDGELKDLGDYQNTIQEKFEKFSHSGLRTLGIAYKKLEKTTISPQDENELIFLGFITLLDPPKEDITQTISELKHLGISLKMITGDNLLVAQSVAQNIGFEQVKILTGTEIRQLSNEALLHKVSDTNVFAEIEPNQKESIVLALKKAGFVVGYMGDGINDASALHAADVGISVDTAVDVAKESADMVLLESDLNVLINGVKEGRKTFANTMKYVFMATSANFGNMFSVAGASLFLPFLPLLPKQILLTNLLTDMPEMMIASDHVEKEMINRPAQWDLKFIRRFMIYFGLLSSVFDYLSFAVLLFIFEANEKLFQTGWFVESIASATCIVFVVRTRTFFLRSKPSRPLALMILLTVLVVFYLPFSPLASSFGFVALPTSLYWAIVLIVLGYLACAELLKLWFYRKLL